MDTALGEGIHYALASGLLAGDFRGAVLVRGEPLSHERLTPYVGLVRRRLGGRLLASRLASRAARTPALDLALRLGSRKSGRALFTRLLEWA